MTIWYLLCFYNTRYHWLPYALTYMLLYFYGNFAPFLLVSIFSTLPEVLLNVFQYIFNKISTWLSIFQRVTMRYHKFFKNILIYFFLKKKLMVMRGNALKIIQVCIISLKMSSKAYISLHGNELIIVVRWKRYKITIKLR